LGRLAAQIEAAGQDYFVGIANKALKANGCKPL
jgi:hypothetical protein